MRAGTTNPRALGLAIAATAFALACHGPSMLYDASNPAVVQGCPNRNDDNSATRAYAATMKALSEFSWRFDQILPQQGTLVATACLGGSADCVTMVFSVAQDGGVSVRREENRLVLDEMDGHMIRWLRNFEQKFLLYRCMTMDVAILELKKFGAIEDSTTSAPPPAPPPTAAVAPQQPDPTAAAPTPAPTIP